MTLSAVVATAAVGVASISIHRLYEATKLKETGERAWRKLKRQVAIWNLITAAVVLWRFFRYPGFFS